MTCHAPALPSALTHLDAVRQQVTHKPRQTAAHDQLADAEAVGGFLDHLATIQQRKLQA